MTKIILAGGCFWGMQDILRKIPGVKKTLVGYSGGHLPEARYEDVKTGSTGHAESILIEFDKATLPLNILLDYFFRMHDPTTVDRQGGDVGSQYRSAIFYFDEEQKQTALKKIKDVEASKQWDGKKVVTQVVPAGAFYEAEGYHQDYLEKNPGGYTCHFLRPQK